MGESELGLNSHSHTTLVSEMADQDQKPWPFAFESPFRVDHNDLSGTGISPAQLESCSHATSSTDVFSHAYNQSHFASTQSKVLLLTLSA